MVWCVAAAAAAAQTCWHPTQPLAKTAGLGIDLLLMGAILALVRARVPTV